MKPRILVILESGESNPSGIVRGGIYRDYFLQNGFETKYLSRSLPQLASLLLSPPYWLQPLMAAGLRRVLFFLSGGISRIMEAVIFKHAKHYDVIYASRVLRYGFWEKLRRQTKARLILDCGDAIWLPQFGVRRIEETLRLVDAVTTDNERTAEYVRQYNPNCTVIPESSQVELFDRQRGSIKNPSDQKIITVGWIGTPHTIFNIFLIWEALERLFSRHDNLHLRMVGTGWNGNLPAFEKVKYSCRPQYDQAGMIEEVLAMDIGLFPQFDVEANRVRGVLKAEVYMAGEAVVVSSPVGQSAELIQDGVNGMLAASTGEWVEKLEMLITNPDLRRRLSQSGLELVRREFTIAQSFEKLVSVLTAKS